MTTLDEVYNSMCIVAQDLIDFMDKHIEDLTDKQFKNLQAKIDKIHKHMDDDSKKRKP